jgi:hypothetical protein
MAQYRVAGTALAAQLTYANATGGTEQHTVNLPWSSDIFPTSADEFLYISAQNQGEYGSVVVEILVDGVVWKTSESSGQYCIADASGAYGQ